MHPPGYLSRISASILLLPTKCPSASLILHAIFALEHLDDTKPILKRWTIVGQLSLSSTRKPSRKSYHVHVPIRFRA